MAAAAESVAADAAAVELRYKYIRTRSAASMVRDVDEVWSGRRGEGI